VDAAHQICVFAVAQKLLGEQVLFDPLKEKFHLGPVHTPGVPIALGSGDKEGACLIHLLSRLI